MTDQPLASSWTERADFQLLCTHFPPWSGQHSVKGTRFGGRRIGITAPGFPPKTDLKHSSGHVEEILPVRGGGEPEGNLIPVTHPIRVFRAPHQPAAKGTAPADIQGSDAVAEE